MRKMLTGQKMILSALFSILVIAAMFFSNTANNSVFAAEIQYSNEVVEIATAGDLFKLTDNRYSRKIFRLTNDIDLSADESWRDYVSDWQTNGWQPLDTYGMTE